MNQDEGPELGTIFLEGAFPTSIESSRLLRNDSIESRLCPRGIRCVWIWSHGLTVTEPKWRIPAICCIYTHVGQRLNGDSGQPGFWNTAILSLKVFFNSTLFLEFVSHNNVGYSLVRSTAPSAMSLLVQDGANEHACANGDAQWIRFPVAF